MDRNFKVYKHWVDTIEEACDEEHRVDIADQKFEHYSIGRFACT